jgi:hypothetical protein
LRTCAVAKSMSRPNVGRNLARAALDFGARHHDVPGPLVELPSVVAHRLARRRGRSRRSCRAATFARRRASRSRAFWRRASDTRRPLGAFARASVVSGRRHSKAWSFGRRVRRAGRARASMARAVPSFPRRDSSAFRLPSSARAAFASSSRRQQPKDRARATALTSFGERHELRLERAAAGCEKDLPLARSPSRSGARRSPRRSIALSAVNVVGSARPASSLQLALREPVGLPKRAQIGPVSRPTRRAARGASARRGGGAHRHLARCARGRSLAEVGRLLHAVQDSAIAGVAPDAAARRRGCSRCRLRASRGTTSSVAIPHRPSCSAGLPSRTARAESSSITSTARNARRRQRVELRFAVGVDHHRRFGNGRRSARSHDTTTRPKC